MFIKFEFSINLKLSYTNLVMTITRKGRKDIENSGYYRCLASCDNDQIALDLATIFSENQSQVISNGNMLDNKIIPSPEFNPNNVIKKFKSCNLDLKECEGHYSQFCLLKKDCQSLKKGCIQIDYLVISKDYVRIYEIKDGDNFDTKKSEGEVESLEKAKIYFVKTFPDKEISYHVVLWNAYNKKCISFKANELPENFIIFGRDFCKDYNINFQNILTYRQLLAKEYQKYLIENLKNVIKNY
jgi:hypothetical protein